MTSRRTWGLRLGVAATALVAGVAVTALDRDEPVAAPAPSATVPTTTTTTTTTEVPVVVDPGLTEVATATVPEVEVLAELPPEAATARSTSQATAADARRATFAALSPERAGAPDLPTIEHPIRGRHRTEVGWRFGNPTPWGSPLVFVVIEDQGDWLRVQLPVRPNGTEGWVRASEVTRSTHRFRVEIDVSERRLWAWDDTTLLADTAVVVGKDRTRTPTGRFFVTDFEQRSRGSAYGPWILPVNAYSQDLDQFAGGVPVIALHGTNRPDLLGTAASNGCVRMPDDVVQLLRDRLPLGTPVDIRA